MVAYNSTIETKIHFQKWVELIKFVLYQFHDLTTGFHKLSKILYFADKYHLASYGRTITGDTYIAMESGPVPSSIYDILKFLRGDGIYELSQALKSQFEVTNKHNIRLVTKNLDIDLLSESEIECLMISFKENKDLSFEELVDKSHDSAWKAADQDDKMSMLEIAKAAGVNSAMLNYIALRLEDYHSMAS